MTIYGESYRYSAILRDAGEDRRRLSPDQLLNIDRQRARLRLLVPDSVWFLRGIKRHRVTILRVTGSAVFYHALPSKKNPRGADHDLPLMNFLASYSPVDESWKSA